MKKIIFIFLTTIFAFNMSAQAPTDSIQQKKPHRPDNWVHDPVMTKQGDTYYVFCTGKGITIKTSTDRANWKFSGSVFEEPLSWWKNDIPEQDGNIWAPDIQFRDGKYYLYYSVSAWMNFNSSIGFATNTTLDPKDPIYKWIDGGMIINAVKGGEGVNCIDPNVFVDDNGKVWLFYGSYKAGLRLVELDRKTGKLKSDKAKPIVITTSLGEGVFVIKAQGWYYIFASRGRCCAGIESTYNVVVGRSKNVKGPYLNKEGKSWVNNDCSSFLVGNYEEPGRGHNGFFTENDTTFIVYHAYTRSANGASLLNIKPVYLDNKDWPTMEKSDRVLLIGKKKK